MKFLYAGNRQVSYKSQVHEDLGPPAKINVLFCFVLFFVTRGLDFIIS